MAFDFKKEYKEFYMPKNKPEIVNVPKDKLYCSKRKRAIRMKRMVRISRRLAFYMQLHIHLR